MTTEDKVVGFRCIDDTLKHRARFSSVRIGREEPVYSTNDHGLNARSTRLLSVDKEPASIFCQLKMSCFLIIGTSTTHLAATLISRPTKLTETPCKI